ncbi:HIT family protein [Amycolatopsis minnesotensis]|uniref:HIT family protein n=1 Tax=Amycolatopsis minnesotensis TaxID=337894 RepID=A0ABP5CKQ1_9PSEU
MNQTVTIDQPKSHPGRQVGCLFCEFEDDALNSVVDQTENFYARRDNYPAAEGHVEIVPKRHVVSFFDLSSDDMAELYGLMSKVKVGLQNQYHPQGYTIGVNDGRAAGRTVDHLHIHLIPRHEGDVQDPRGGIRQILPNCHPDEWNRDDQA